MKKRNKENIDDVINGMTKFQQSRWLALYEAVNIIADKAEDRGTKFDQLTLKQPALEKYIESTCDSICKCLEMNEKKEGLKIDRRKKHQLAGK